MVVDSSYLRKSRKRRRHRKRQSLTQMLIDIQAKMAEGKTVGYEKWAKKFKDVYKRQGIGNFFGMLPPEMQSSRLYGVELDSITGRIAQKLYPLSLIHISSPSPKRKEPER